MKPSLTNKNNDYDNFLKTKEFISNEIGFNPKNINTMMFDFQQSLFEWSCLMGRSAIFADCGLGKTIIQLCWAREILEKTNKPVLILTPLAVSNQTVREGSKFGIECKRIINSSVVRGINILNYEKIHLVNDVDFGGIVCDECFAPDTKIKIIRDKKLHVVDIKDCQKNDYVINCTGIDKINSIKERKIKYAIEIGFNGQKIISSPNHPYFTQRGWVSAKEIQKNDFIMSSDKAMRILQGEFSDSLQGRFEEKILRDILLSEMENEAAGNFEKSTQFGSCEEARIEKKSMVEFGSSQGKKGNRTASEFEAYAKSGNTKESFCEIERDKTSTFHTWGEWSWNDIAAAIDQGCFVRRMDTGICYIFGEITKGLPDKLQNRLSEFRKENCNRSGWELSLFEKKARQKEGQKTGLYGVESFEILESGNHRLDKYRNESRELYFYDLEIERHPSFTINDCLVHNSSILKNFSGAYRKEITSMMKKVKYRLLCTATAAPNDYIELGTSSEALGVFGHMDMLSMFFKNDQNTCDTKRHWIRTGGSAPQWRFKKHAEQAFWKWVVSWARAIRKPSDLGFNDDKFILHKLNEVEHIISATRSPKKGQLFALPAVGLFEQREERRETLKQRCEKINELVADKNISVIWCHLNDEGDYLEKIIPESVQIKGSTKNEKKESILEDFSKGNIRRLIIKPKIGGFGLNWQHCNHVTFFPSHSYEQYYQAIRRCWRFGQKNDVTVDIVTTKGELSVLDNLQRKSVQADRMFSQLVEYMNNAINIDAINFGEREEFPSWL